MAVWDEGRTLNAGVADQEGIGGARRTDWGSEGWDEAGDTVGDERRTGVAGVVET